MPSCYLRPKFLEQLRIIQKISSLRTWHSVTKLLKWLMLWHSWQSTPKGMCVMEMPRKESSAVSYNQLLPQTKNSDKNKLTRRISTFSLIFLISFVPKKKNIYIFCKHTYYDFHEINWLLQKTTGKFTKKKKQTSGQSGRENYIRIQC